MHLVRKFNKVGDLLADFAKATKRIKSRKKTFNGKNTGPGKLESVDGSVKKTDAHGAETGEVSKPKPTQVPSVHQLIDEELDLSNSLNGLEGDEFVKNAEIEYHLNPHVDGVQFDEFLSLHVYTTNLYQPINNGLRGLDPVSKQRWSGVAEKADSALRKLSENGQSYEGTVVRGDTFSDDMIETLFPEGGIHSDPGFKSSSMDPEGAFTGNTITYIRSKSGVNIRDLSVKPNEEEVLFRPKTKFKVISKTKSPDGKTSIILEEISE
jgi:hypothetical protein